MYAGPLGSSASDIHSLPLEPADRPYTIPSGVGGALEPELLPPPRTPAEPRSSTLLIFDIARDPVIPAPEDDLPPVMPGFVLVLAVFPFLGLGDPWPPPPPPSAPAPLPPAQSLPNPLAAGPFILPLLASELPRDDDTALRFGGEQRLVSGHPPSEHRDPFASATDDGDLFTGAEPKFLPRKAPSPRLCSSSSEEDVSSRSRSEAGRRGGDARSISPLRLFPMVALFAGRADNHGCPI